MNSDEETGRISMNHRVRHLVSGQRKKATELELERHIKLCLRNFVELAYKSLAPVDFSKEPSRLILPITPKCRSDVDYYEKREREP